MTQPNHDSNGLPTQAEYGQRRSYCARLGISQAQFEALFGPPGNPKHRRQGAADCATWVRTLPKKQEQHGGGNNP